MTSTNTKIRDTSVDEMKEVTIRNTIENFLVSISSEGDIPLFRLLNTEETYDYHLLKSEKLSEYDLSIMSIKEKITYGYLFKINLTDLVVEIKPVGSIEYTPFTLTFEK